jgi:glycolate oxidase iron-sulfur subunit
MAPDLRFADLNARTPRRLAPRGPRVLRVALLTGCVQDAFFSHVNRATARVLAAHGCEVLVPPLQSCCGALEIHSGREQSALQRMRALIAQMEPLGVDRIVVNSAGCGSAMKEYGALLADDPFWSARAARFSAGVRDVMEVIAELEVQLPSRLHSLPVRVAYHDACHLAHAQGVRLQPRNVLGRIPDLELVDLREPDVCCGSAGIYNVLHTDMALDILQHKMSSVNASKADVIATANPGCMLQLRAGVRLFGTGQRVMHVIEILDEAYKK